MEIRDLMTGELITLKPEDSIRTAAEKMKTFRLDTIPVMDGDDCVGIITESDIVVNGVADHRALETNIKFVMSKDLHDLNSKATVQKAAELMEENSVKRILIRNDDGSVAGIISLDDIALSLNKELEGGAFTDISGPVPG